MGGTLTDQHGNLAHFEVRLESDDLQRHHHSTALLGGGASEGDSGQLSTWRDGSKGGVAANDLCRSCIGAEPLLHGVGLDLHARFRQQPRHLRLGGRRPGGPPHHTEDAVDAAVELGHVRTNRQRAATRSRIHERALLQQPVVPQFLSCPPNKSTEKNGVPTGIPTQVTRRVPIGAAAAARDPSTVSLCQIGWQRPRRRTKWDPAPDPGPWDAVLLRALIRRARRYWARQVVEGERVPVSGSGWRHVVRICPNVRPQLRCRINGVFCVMWRPTRPTSPLSAGGGVVAESGRVDPGRLRVVAAPHRCRRYRQRSGVSPPRRLLRHGQLKVDQLSPSLAQPRSCRVMMSLKIV